jgi:hypothetical protein
MNDNRIFEHPQDCSSPESEREFVLPSFFFFLLHDNAPAYKAANVCQFLTQKNITTLYHPPYSPDLSPPDYFIFPKFENEIKRTPLCGCC